MKIKQIIGGIIAFILAVIAVMFIILPRQQDNETSAEVEEYTEQSSAQPLRIYSFNIQIFGVAKMAKQDVVAILVDLISSATIVAVQEVRSVSTEPVEQFMALLPPQYRFVLGPREGRTASKEQYWIIYDSTMVTVIGEHTYPDPQDTFQRNPLAVYFTAGNFDFIIIDNHIQPSDAVKEIAALPELVRYYQDLWHDTDVLVLGDFNADGTYYDEEALALVFPPEQYYSVIGNEYDTTVAPSNNTYDRFIITKSAQRHYTGNCGVIRFDEIYDLGSAGIAPQDISDHYPIWAEFSMTAQSSR
ncbi:MAG: endonuclease [Spirochaetaceae bacterium]|jgi:endonuclease/exonuclease/phosphatase family metal-dependent hydrolase|nr:endonuclease [Spirochaetaceae bacterium]